MIFLCFWSIWEGKITNVPRETMNTMSGKKRQNLTVKDHLVSGEKFTLEYDESLDLFATKPRPKPELLHKYYESTSYISHTDGRKTFIENCYHLVKNYALKKKVSLITKENVSPGKLLDIGAGTGDFLVCSKNNGWQVTGVEPNPSARNLALSKGVELSEKLTEITTEEFDAITLWHVLEHLPNLEQDINFICSKLKKNGVLAIAVPNYNSYDAKHYKEYWAAYDVPRHLWHFSKKSISKLFEKEGFEVKKIKPMWFDSFYVSLLSEKYKSGKSNYLSAFWTGCYSNLKGIFSKEYSSHIYILKKK